METYEIGIYNKLIDNKDMLKKCNKIFEIEDFSKFEKYVRKNDTIVICSIFTLYGICMKDMLDIKENFNLRIICLGNKDIDTNTPYGNAMFQMHLATLEFIANQKDEIGKIINS